MSDLGNDAISFFTNFIGQILVIIAGIVAGVKYVLSEIRKGNERLGKKILGDEQDGRVGKGGLLDELRTELRTEFNREIEDLRKELVAMITDSHKELLNEFRRTSIKISYMSRDFNKMERSLEKMSGGRYMAAKQETLREYRESDDFYEGLGDGDVNGGDINGNDDDSINTFNMDRFNRKHGGNKNK